MCLAHRNKLTSVCIGGILIILQTKLEYISLILKSFKNEQNGQVEWMLLFFLLMFKFANKDMLFLIVLMDLHGVGN